MASTEEPSLPLRLFVDKEKNRVVVAEASGEFVDTLFSFLTLPLGTIIRHEPVEIGCIKNLYRSVENFNTEAFWNHICKKMLLRPRNPCQNLCQKLGFNVDDSEPTKYFMCSSNCKRLLSTFAETRCSCGKVMDKEMKLQGDPNEEAHHENGFSVWGLTKFQVDPNEEARHKNGVFVRGESMYLVFDDLKVLQSSPGNSVKQLVQLGYRDFKNLTEMSTNVGLKEILELLKRALTSKSPLSDVLLAVADGESKPSSFLPIPEAKNLSYCYDDVNLKITVSKSKNKILYAEAEGDFSDFLFSFLTLPLGSILRVLDGNLFMGSMDNLYRTVKGLSSSWFTGSPGSVTSLLNLQVASQFGSSRQPLMVYEEETPSYWYGTGVIRNNISFGNSNGVISKNRDLVSHPAATKLFDPRSADGTRDSPVGFVKRPSVFVVMDDLQVIPLTSTSSISFLQKLNVPLDDLEEHVVRIGPIEAQNLLGASLTSKAALTDGLFYLLKKSKGELV